jgi:hypothetical protein
MRFLLPVVILIVAVWIWFFEDESLNAFGYLCGYIGCQLIVGFTAVVIWILKATRQMFGGKIE